MSYAVFYGGRWLGDGDTVDDAKQLADTHQRQMLHGDPAPITWREPESDGRVVSQGTWYEISEWRKRQPTPTRPGPAPSGPPPPGAR